MSVYQFHNINDNPWFYELSALAWDYDEKLLYSVTDNGHLNIFNVVFNDNKIADIQLISHHPLTDESGQILTGKMADSESLALLNHNNDIAGDSELLVSFERVPRVVRYNTQGEFVDNFTIPNELSDTTRFQSSNKQLEAITEHPLHEIIIGPERPMDKVQGKIQLFNHNKQIAQLSLKHAKHGSLVSMTTLPSHNVIALERVFINVFTGLQFHLHLLTQTPTGFDQSTLFSSAIDDGYLNDNFEGITHHKDNYFFMVSDDNENAYQRTLLIYFRLLDLKT